jgi:hypothetical protein
MKATEGGFTLTELMNLPFDDFNLLIERTNLLLKQIEAEESKEDE